MIDAKALEQECRTARLSFIRHSDFHLTVRGRYDVNVYPSTRKVFIKGSLRGASVTGIAHIIELAQGERAADVGPLAKRRQLTDFKKRLWRRGHYCGICSEPIDSIDEATVDHIVPRARGGSNREDNLQLAHADCNSERGADLK